VSIESTKPEVPELDPDDLLNSAIKVLCEKDASQEALTKAGEQSELAFSLFSERDSGNRLQSALVTMGIRMRNRDPKGVVDFGIMADEVLGDSIDPLSHALIRDRIELAEIQIPKPPKK
jgi:hypothetical protein